MRNRPCITQFVWFLASVTMVTPCQAQNHDGVLSRTALVEDVQHLVTVLEDVHPSPFVAGGGRLAFYKRVDEVIQTIPETGLDSWAFYERLLPVVAGIGDVHTRLGGPEGLSARGFAIPLDFVALDDALYVKEAYHQEHHDLVSARLDSVGGRAFSDLIERQKSLAGNENPYSGLDNLPRFLRWRNGFRLLLPEVAAAGGTWATFRLPGGERRAVYIPFPDSIRWSEARSLPSQITLPDTQGEPAYAFLDEARQTALLSIDDMTSYREAFEWFRHHEYDAEAYAREIYTRYQIGPPPADYDLVLEGLPSASAIFSALIAEMEEAGTKTLLIDLRFNSGGNSLLQDLLIHALLGWEGLEAIDNEYYSILKCSDLYLETYPTASPGCSVGDYEFGRGQPEEAPPTSLRAELTASSPTFARTAASQRHYLPPNLAVLTSPSTQSSALTLAASLAKLGATVVGVPPGERVNHFGEVLRFRLPNSGLEGRTSSKLHVIFPDDPLGHDMLAVDVPLTFAVWQQYDFDRHAAVLLARDFFTQP